MLPDDVPAGLMPFLLRLRPLLLPLFLHLLHVRRMVRFFFPLRWATVRATYLTREDLRQRLSNVFGGVNPFTAVPEVKGRRQTAHEIRLGPANGHATPLRCNPAITTVPIYFLKCRSIVRLCMRWREGSVAAVAVRPRSPRSNEVLPSARSTST